MAEGCTVNSITGRRGFLALATLPDVDPYFWTDQPLVKKPIVLDVGNCPPDHAAISRMLAQTFDAQVIQAHGLEDTLDVLRTKPVNLILINRKLDIDYSDGLEILKHLKSQPDFAEVPVMLITNYDEHQDVAVAHGARRGFGKLSLTDADTRRRLAEVFDL